MTRPVIFGEVLFDCFENGPRVLGGAPFNVAWNLAGFGEAPFFISRVGDDEPGSEILHIMEMGGLETAGVEIDPLHPTGEVRVKLEHGEPSYDIVDGCAWDFIEAAAAVPDDAALLYHGTLALRHEKPARAVEVVRQQADLPVFMDVNLREPWWSRDFTLALLQTARWLKLNADELSLLGNSDPDVTTAARRLLERHGLAMVIVTMGKRGAMALNESGEVATVAPREDLQVVDPVGAGDAFASVCLLGIMKGWPLEMTLERAQAFASVTVRQTGAIIHDPLIFESVRANWDK